MTRSSIIGVIFGVLFYVAGLTKAVLTPVENIFFGFPKGVQIALFVAVIALWIWIAGQRFARRRELYRQANRITTGHMTEGST
ncbi:MAG: hypothetical protein ACERLM_01525 [Acidimicrobiales bacterium]